MIAGSIYSQGMSDQIAEYKSLISCRPKQYVQLIVPLSLFLGAAMHSTAIMAKHEIENAEDNNPQMVLQYPVVKEVENYYQETLEHLVTLITT